MRELNTSLSLKHAAERAFEHGDYMLAMDLLGDACELADTEGRKELAVECALKIRDVIMKMAEIDGIKFPD